MTMEQALYLSSNTYFMALQDALGSIEGPVRVAERMGMHFTASSADQIIGGNRGSFTLGAEATTPAGPGQRHPHPGPRRPPRRPAPGPRRPRPHRRTADRARRQTGWQ